VFSLGRYFYRPFLFNQFLNLIYTAAMVLDLDPRLEKLVRESVRQGTFPSESAVIEASLESFFTVSQSNAYDWEDLAAMFAQNPTDGRITDIALNHDDYLNKLEHESV
jgi:Arc/MetJ-type ribon-helix-helix transcriptional regulator